MQQQQRHQAMRRLLLLVQLLLVPQWPVLELGLVSLLQVQLLSWLQEHLVLHLLLAQQQVLLQRAQSVLQQLVLLAQHLKQVQRRLTQLRWQQQRQHQLLV